MSNRQRIRLRNVLHPHVRNTVLTLLLLTLTACGPKVVYLSGEKATTQSPVASLSDEELMEFVRRFYVEALEVENPEIVQISGPQPPPKTRSFNVSWNSKRRESYVTIDATNDNILRYSLDFAEWEHYPEEERGKLEARGYSTSLGDGHSSDSGGKSGGDAETVAATPLDIQYEVYTQEAAFKAIEPLLRYLKQPMDIGKYEIASREVMRHESWMFRIGFQHEGVPFIGKSLSVCVSKYSGLVVFITHEPIVENPRVPKESISKSVALDVAKDSVSRNEHFKWRLFRGYQWSVVDYDVDLENLDEVIVLPQSISSMHKSEKAYIDGLIPGEPRYCWRVPFAYTTTDSNAPDTPVDSIWCVYVDIETGRVVR